MVLGEIHQLVQEWMRIKALLATYMLEILHIYSGPLGWCQLIVLPFLLFFLFLVPFHAVEESFWKICSKYWLCMPFRTLVLKRAFFSLAEFYLHGGSVASRRIRSQGVLHCFIFCGTNICMFIKRQNFFLVNHFVEIVFLIVVCTTELLSEAKVICHSMITVGKKTFHVVCHS